ncbi:gamma-glutamyltransferase [Pseudomonas sp. LS2P72]
MALLFMGGFQLAMASPRTALTHAAVAVPDQFAADTANAIFAKGGNAVDAAVAVAFSLAVTYPETGNIGGGGFMTLYYKGKPYFLDYRERAPLKATRDMFVDNTGKKVIAADQPEGSVIGHRSVGVPGTVAGMWEAHKRFGKLRWAELIEPAIHYAHRGFVVDEALASIASTENERRFAGKTNFAEYFGKLQAGTTFKQPELEACYFHKRWGARPFNQNLKLGQRFKLIVDRRLPELEDLTLMRRPPFPHRADQRRKRVA